MARRSRAAVAAEKRAKGMSWAVIARETGYSSGAAARSSVLTLKGAEWVWRTSMQLYLQQYRNVGPRLLSAYDDGARTIAELCAAAGCTRNIAVKMFAGCPNILPDAVQGGGSVDGRASTRAPGTAGRLQTHHDDHPAARAAAERVHAAMLARRAAGRARRALQPEAAA